MSPLDGFLATWSQAVQTFGQGVPVGGAQFDRSPFLRQLRADVESAAPGERWLGAAAAAYQAANATHAEAIGKLAALDARLAGEIDKSAGVVNSGRADLDNLRDWVVGAASSVPEDQTGKIMLIVSNGLGQLSAILTKANEEFNAIGAQIEHIGTEYAALSRETFAS